LPRLDKKSFTDDNIPHIVLKEYQLANKPSSSQYLECPLCDVEIPMAGDESIGEQIACPYCQSPLLLKKRTEQEKDVLYLEEDF